MLTGFATTALFVPGDRPALFAKARGAGAGFVILDLEDAVTPANKATARDTVIEALAKQGISAAVRVNASASDFVAADLAGLAALPDHARPAAVVVPKAESPDDLVPFAALGTPLIPMIESAVGLRDIDAIAAASGVVRLAFGAIDFATDVGAFDDDSIANHARARIVIASRAAGIAAPLDSPEVAIPDIDGLQKAARSARNMGFGGKLCIHPTQVGPVERTFLPPDAEIAWAKRIAESDGGAVRIDGQMVDRAVVLRAERILQASGKVVG